MKLLKILVAISALILLSDTAMAKGDIFYTVPFNNVEVPAASKIYVNYAFDPHRQILVCSGNSDDDAITSVEWVYKDATRKIDLPVMLKDDANFSGYYADPEGKLVITNEFGTSSQKGSMTVSCEYQKGN